MRLPAPERMRWAVLVPVAVTVLVLAVGCGPSGPAREAPAIPSPVLPGPGTLPALRMTAAWPNLRFVRPLWLTHDGSGRLYVVEQAGRVRLLPADSNEKTAPACLDLTDRVRTVNNEEGLLALAFHPRYAENGFLYVYYSASDPLRGVLARFRRSAADPLRADPASEKVVLEVLQPYGNHNGASVLFGPDGFLYLSLGDGGAGGDPHGNGQSLETLLGKILRLDVDREEAGRAYAIPEDNPFVTRPGARGEIWAYGLRNVWRMSFDRETGELWAGDVGQDLWEEVDLIVKGGNYGWNLREGAHPFKSGKAPQDPLIDPVLDYGRKDGACITGGYVYRGQRIPALRGAYVYGDFVSGSIWALRGRDGRVVEQRKVVAQPENIASFGEGPDGEIYVLAFNGRIYRLEESP